MLILAVASGACLPLLAFLPALVRSAIYENASELPGRRFDFVVVGGTFLSALSTSFVPIL